MKKKLISALLSVAMVSALLAGCGSKAEPERTPAPVDKPAEAAGRKRGGGSRSKRRRQGLLFELQTGAG